MITYKTLLLTVLVAGATTIAGDAHAQSENTLRIQDIQNTTHAIFELTDAIPDFLSTIQASINGLASTMQTLSSDVADLSSDVASLTPTMTENTARIESAISNFEPTLLSIATGVDTNRNTLGALSGILADMKNEIDSAVSLLNNQNDDALIESIDFLTSALNRNELTVSDRLDDIEAAIESLEAKLDSPAESGVRSTGIMPGSATMSVTSYTYLSQGDKRTEFGQDVYDLEFTFSCNEPVSIETVRTSLTNLVSWIVPDTTPSFRTPENYLDVNGQNLYNSRFESSANSYIVLNRPVNFGFQDLYTGQTLNFESQQYDTSADKIANADKTARDGYIITVEYLGSSTTVCSFSGSDENVADPLSEESSLPESGSLSLTPLITTGSILNTFNTDITCNGNPAVITGVQAEAGDGWSPSLANFAKIILSLPESDTSVMMGFNNNGVLNNYEDQILFSGENMNIHGEIPGARSLLIHVSYNTVEGGLCRVTS